MIEFNFSFSSLFKLSVQHNFYVEQPSRDFKIIPTPETQKLVKRLGLVLKESNGEWVLLYELDKIEGLYAEVNNNNARFTFFLHTVSPYFINITDLPVENSTGLFYFSNNFTYNSGDKTCLHPSEFVRNADRTPVKGEIEVKGDGKEKQVELKDDAGNVLLRRTVGAADRIVINNTSVPVGRYQLYINGKASDTFILYSNMPAQKPIGIVEISLSGSIKKEFMEGVEDNNIPLYDYKISFGSRKTYWKYFLIGKYQASLKNSSIDASSSKLKFKGPEMVKMKNGEDAAVFVSEEPLALKQIQDYKFQLKTSRSGVSNGKVLMDRLPLASPDMIRPESREEDSKVYSEIIVYI